MRSIFRANIHDIEGGGVGLLKKFARRIFVTVFFVEIFNFIGYANIQRVTSNCIMSIVLSMRLLILSHITIENN